MKIAFYSGSFDPFTEGHMEVVKKASALFDKLIVGVGINPLKKRRFDKILMLNGITKSIKQAKLTNVDVIEYDGLTTNIAKQNNATILVRGIRDGTDYQYEERIAMINEEIADFDTIYIRAGIKGVISSSMVYELFKHGENVSKYVPHSILEIIKEQIKC